MRITALKLKNVRGFQNVKKTEFSKSINVFIGSNNAGKSTILNSIYSIQIPGVLSVTDITIGQTEGSIELFFEGQHLPEINPNLDSNKILFNLSNGSRIWGYDENNQQTWNGSIPSIEPHNLIYPYLSKRKVVNYSEVINESSANSVSGNFTHLYSKIDRLNTTQYQSGNKQYLQACNDILGFEVSSLAKGNGKQAGYFIKKDEFIQMTSMGEGVANILGLITDLCVSEERIFLIEEPENDIHPKALKALLNLIIEKSPSNQFFISTHSNIVMKYLGSATEAKIFNITNNERDLVRENLFVSEMKEVSENQEERRQVLEDLGYDFFDFDLWKGWLFLEESSAEIIIRDYFIDWFVPNLKNKIRTFSAGGTGNVITKFEDFNRLFVFLHLEPTYKNKVWVLIDGGADEVKIITEMKDKYYKSGWDESNFNQLKKHDFENYYPEKFQDKVSKILAIKDKQKKRNAKKDLLEEIKYWIKNDESHAKKLFTQSAKEIITHLEKINIKLNS